jgi:glyoxylase-like metal-dependent hydrolase (beta-lactamase superfamily II)
MELYSINAGYFKLDGGAMHGVVPKSMWNKVNPADDNNMCTWAMRCLLVVTGDRKILIDNGMGNKQDAKFFGHYYPSGDDSVDGNLARHGFSPDDITDVFLTHLHFDHCGGSIVREGDKLVPAFRNAQYWSNAAHWEAAVHPNEREKASFLKENILPIEECGKLNFVTSGNNEEWIPGIQIVFAYGHTESMMLPLITFGSRKVLFCADLLPSVAHISLPWVMAYDMRPLQTLTEKQTILTRAAEDNWVLYLEHDAKNECCMVQQTDRGVRLKETFLLSELTAAL